ncbi:MAG: M3 family oligoendopeptidase [Promethearchaeota archaeon]
MVKKESKGMSAKKDCPLKMKERKYLLEGYSPNSIIKVNKELNRLKRNPLKTEEDLLQFADHYSEVYDTIEDVLYLKVVKYMSYKKVKDLFRVLGYGIRVFVPVFLKNRKVTRKLYESEILKEIPATGHDLSLLKRIIENEYLLNIKKPLLPMIKEYLKIFGYSNKTGKLTVKFEGKKETLTKMVSYYFDPDRDVREKAWRALNQRLMEKSEYFNKVFDKMLVSRIKQAKKMGYDDPRQYFHDAKKRFDYTPDDCFKFHEAVERYVLPIAEHLHKKRQEILNIESIRPWDKYVPIWKLPDKKIYNNIDEFIEKMVKTYSEIHPDFGLKLKAMADCNFLDLENRKGKYIGGMTIPLSSYNAAFIFTNFTNSLDDINTFAHEGGHALHFFYDSPLNVFYRNFPMEIAELASMSMELFILEYAYPIFFEDEYQANVFKKQKFENILNFLPYCVTVDAFQHWIYANPDHTHEERMKYFANLIDRFDGASGIDYSGLEQLKSARWLRQMHIFQFPFYYIDYGIAQLGALGVYKNYLKSPQKTIEQYIDFMKLGFSKSLPEVYETAGTVFAFSGDIFNNFKEIMDFVKQEYDKIKLDS